MVALDSVLYQHTKPTEAINQRDGIGSSPRGAGTAPSVPPPAHQALVRTASRREPVAASCRPRPVPRPRQRPHRRRRRTRPQTDRRPSALPRIRPRTSRAPAPRQPRSSTASPSWSAAGRRKRQPRRQSGGISGGRVGARRRVSSMPSMDPVNWPPNVHSPPRPSAEIPSNHHEKKKLHPSASSIA